VRPRRSSGVVVRPLNFTVRRRLGHEFAPMNPFARAFLVMNRVFGALAAFVGIYVIAGSLWAMLHGSQNYRGFIIGPIFLIVGILYLKAPLSRQHSQERRSDGVSQDH